MGVEAHGVAWLLWFADPDVPPELFTGPMAEAAARVSFERARGHWTCRLFREVGRSSGISEEALAGRRVLWGREDAEREAGEEVQGG